MSLRKKFFYTMRRQGEGFIPFEFVLCPSLSEEFEKRTGKKDYEEYYDFPVRTLSVEYIGKREKFFPYHNNLGELEIDRWGVGHKKGSLAHFSEMVHPMEGFTDIDDFEKYPYTDPEKDYNWDGFFAKVKELKDRDLVVASSDIEETVFETAWYLRGMEQLLVDFAINKEPAHYHMDRITDISCAFARKLALAGCDVLRLGDDVSTQLDMMMSPEAWRTFIKPRLAKVIKAAKEIKPDIMIFYHGDGNLQRIIPELIEVGVEILNPIQPECMDPVEIKKQYGHKLSFWGGLGTQTTMPFGTSEEVREICRALIEKVGRGGGFLLAPTHILEPEVPWENIQAFIETVVEFNKSSR